MSKSYSLYIDTTNNYCYAAIYQTKTLINSIKLKVDKNVTDIVVNAIDDLLKQNNVAKEEVDKIFLNIGPGTFTGVKVGVIVAKVWKIVYPDVKIYTSNSLLLQTKELPAVSVIDAKSNKLYIAVYAKDKTILEPTLIDVDQLNNYTGLDVHKIYRDNVDEMYDNFLLHYDKFELVKDIDKLEPIYLKDPVTNK